MSRLPQVLGPIVRTPRRRSPFRSEAGGAGPTGRVRGFRMQTQAGTWWCWAAVASSVAAKYDPNTTWTQCAVATALYDRLATPLDCCREDKPLCDRSQILSQVFAVTGNLVGDAHPDIVAFDEIRREIDADRPVCARIGWRPTLEGGHFVTITGYQVTDGVTYLDVEDPSDEDSFADNRRSMTLEAFTSAYDQMGEWTWTYRTGP